MSASREKKIRQERVQNGYIDPKVEREEKQKKADKKANILYASIAIVFVALAAFLLVWKSGVIQSKKTAVKIDDATFNAADVSFYSYNVYRTYYTYCQQYYGNGSYVSYFLTNDSLKEQAVSQLTETWNWYNDALKSNKDYMTQAKVDTQEVIDSLKKAAETNGYTYKNYLKAVYGEYMTPEIFEKNTTMVSVAGAYSDDVRASFTYTEADMQKYFDENWKTFSYAVYHELLFPTTIASKTDESGKTITATDEELTEKKNAMEVLANAAKAKMDAGANFVELSKEYSEATYSDKDASIYSEGPLGDWLFDTARKEGDKNLIYVEGEGYHLVEFVKTYRDDYNTVDVRHCLIAPETDGLDSSSDTYEADLEKAKDAAKAKAEELYNKWKPNGTEDSFAVMASENSSDGAEGGLYTQVYKGEMVPEFNDWIFDEERKPGDNDIVETDYGFHIMYFVKENSPYWQVRVESAMLSRDYDNYYASISKDQKVEKMDGMKYVLNLL